MENKKTVPDKSGMAERNNPLGQRIPSGKVGPDETEMKHDQSAELVEQVRQKARSIEGQEISTPKNTSDEYNRKGPARQPGKVADQKKLGSQPSEHHQGEYTQDDEEEGPTV
jgi:hypothetical protein